MDVLTGVASEKHAAEPDTERILHDEGNPTP